MKIELIYYGLFLFLYILIGLKITIFVLSNIKEDEKKGKDKRSNYYSNWIVYPSTIIFWPVVLIKSFIKIISKN